MQRRVDVQKLIALRIPKGPLIGRLKNGEQVTLDDGRTIQPDDVYAETVDRTQPTVLIANCPSLSMLDRLKQSNHLRQFYTKTNSLNYIVHLTTIDVLHSDEYQQWMNDFGDETKHLIVNESVCPSIPHLEAAYRTQSMLANIVGDTMFPSLYAATNVDNDVSTSNRVYVKPRDVFRLRTSRGYKFECDYQSTPDERNESIDEVERNELCRLRDDFRTGLIIL